MGNAACAFKPFRDCYMCGSDAAVPSAKAVMRAQCFLKRPVCNLLQPPPFPSGTNSTDDRERKMIDGQRYRQRGAELARRAQQIKAPELRLIYLGLAAGYDRLARFQERADRRPGAAPSEENNADSGVSDPVSRED